MKNSSRINWNNLKIAITGSFGFMDIGDEAMLTEDLDFIANELKIPKDRIYLFGGDPKYISQYHEHPIANCFSSHLLQQDYATLKSRKISRYRKQVKTTIKSLLELRLPRKSQAHSDAAKSCDVLLITGGGTINTRNPEGHSIKRIHSLVKYFAKFGKPIFVSGQTIGPLGLYPEHDYLAKDIVESIDYLSVRDNQYSKRYLEIIGARPKKFVETFDDAYTLPYKEVELPAEVQQFVQSKTTFAVNVTDYTADLLEQRIFISKLCEDIIERFSVNLILISHTPKDYYNLTMIYDMLSNHLKRAVFLPDTRLWRGQDLKKLISTCQVAIGGRYHFIVFAGTSNTPFVGMCGNHYSYIKQDGFARTLGLEDFILTEKDTWNLEVILSCVEKAIHLKLDLESKFQRPSVSMNDFRKWLIELKKKPDKN